MSFNLNQPEHNELPDEFFEQELPADFAALGEQLSADAQRLSSVYPACKPPLELIEALGDESRRVSLPRQILALASVAAGILLMLGLIGFALSPVWLATPPVATPVVNPPGTPGKEPVELVNAPAAPLPSALPTLQPVSYRPALVDVNGPELEGLLDLWQEQPQPESTISF